MQFIASWIDHRRLVAATKAILSTPEVPGYPWFSCASFFDRDVIVVVACFAFFQSKFFKDEGNGSSLRAEYKPFTCQFCGVVEIIRKTWAFNSAFVIQETQYAVTSWKFEALISYRTVYLTTFTRSVPPKRFSLMSQNNVACVDSAVKST